jgi:hypothetical protein
LKLHPFTMSQAKCDAVEALPPYRKRRYGGRCRATVLNVEGTEVYRSWQMPSMVRAAHLVRAFHGACLSA